ncbi:MAG: hypothetical protein AAGA56_04660 [Myxococcota bacterium]
METYIDWIIALIAAVAGAVITATLRFARESGAKQVESGRDHKKHRRAADPGQIDILINRLQAIDGVLERLQSITDGFAQAVGGMREELVALRMRDEEHARSIEKFWATEWTAQNERIEAIARDIVAVRTAIAVLESRIANIEKSQ